MFGKYFRARFVGAKQSVARLGKGKDIKQNELKFAYEFTPQLAEQLGPRAVSLQAMLITDKDAALQPTDAGLNLDTKTVQVKIQHGGGGGKGKIVLTIPMTRAIRVKASAPTKTQANPTLQATLVCEMDTDNMDFTHDYLDEGCTVRLDKRQLQLAPQEEEDEPEPEPEPEEDQ